MNRRELLGQAALMLGGTLSASTIAGILSGCQSVARKDPGGYVPQTLTPTQDEVLATVAELIIPTTDTPGGRAAGVNRFIDGMLTAVYTEAERKQFLVGLADLEARAKVGGASFLASSPERQVGILKALETESLAATTSGTANEAFFRTLKGLTLIGYYRSEIGASQELKYLTIPGYYNGDVPFKEIGRAWSRP